MTKIDAIMREGDMLASELEAALRKLHDPARQPPTLLKMLSGLNTSLSLIGNVCLHQQSGNAHEEHRTGRGAARLSHIFNKCPVRFPEGDFAPPLQHARDPPDVEIEDHIRTWRPGLLKNDEFTPAFEPWKTVAGKNLLRWVNHVLEHSQKGYEGGSLCLVNPNVDLEDGKILAVMHRGVPAVREGITRRAAKIAARGGSTHSAMGALVDGGGGGESKAGGGGGSRPGTGGATSRGPPPDLDTLLETFTPVSRAKTILREMRRLVRPPMGRHVTSEAITGVPEPPTPEEIAAHEKRMARLAEREKESGIIVHVMSRYMGMRIHVHDTKLRVKFALLAEMLSRHPGGALNPPPELEQRALKHLHTAVEHWHAARDSFGLLVEETPVSKTDEYMIELAKQMVDQFVGSQDVCEWLSQGMVDCLWDRAEWMKWRDELTFLQWQSVCTTVLSRKVKVEEDVDDGSFTTIDPLQLMGSVFKRLKIHENQTEQERALAEIVKYCKSRIRDLKRIFQFYAAAEEGDANSMDHVEYWKFVRECKLQKDRRALPSVRVDLCFQAANMDYTKTGSERQESDDGELESVEWIEVMVRLSSWRYPKKPPCLDQRYVKMMQEEVLENACSVDIDVFRERLAGEKVQDCLHKFRKNLKAIYTVYAADDDSDDVSERMLGKLAHTHTTPPPRRRPPQPHRTAPVQHHPAHPCIALLLFPRTHAPTPPRKKKNLTGRWSAGYDEL